MNNKNKNNISLDSPWMRQQCWAAGNVRLMFHAWWVVFSLSALVQIIFWPEAENMISVLLAYSSCVATGLVILRSRVTVFYPWSSLLIVMFCLQTSGLPLFLLVFQGAPLTHSLEVPELTYFHLMVCQMLLLAVHAVYRRSGMVQGIRARFQKNVLQPCGVFTSLKFNEIMIIGVIGLASSIYVYVFVRAEVGGDLAAHQTGPAWQRLANGLIPFSFAPFLILLPNLFDFKKGGKYVRWAVLAVYFMAVFGIAVGWNCRSYLFLGFASAGTSAILMLISGQIRLVLGRLLLIGLIGLLVMGTVGADFADALRVARANRVNKSAMELVQETLAILTVDRQRLSEVKNLEDSAENDDETRYVSNPILCRLVQTHFMDEALAIALHLDSEAKETIRQVEITKIESSFPAPVLDFFGSDIDKNVSVANSMGDWLQMLGHRTNYRKLPGAFITGGFIGDGYAAYGWGYLLAYGAVAFILFFIGDSLYLLTAVSKPGSMGLASRFAIVGLINGFPLATVLVTESIGELVMFIVRTPLQWLVLYGLLVGLIRAALKVMPGNKPQISKNEEPATSGAGAFTQKCQDAGG